LQARRIIYFITFFVLATRVSGLANESPSGGPDHDDNKYWKIGVIFCIIGGVVSLIGLGLRYFWLSYFQLDANAALAGYCSFCKYHCGICQTELVEGYSLRMLPCAHIFHAQCLVDMVAIGRRADCPECRCTFETITPADPEVPWTSSLAQLG